MYRQRKIKIGDNDIVKRIQRKNEIASFYFTLAYKNKTNITGQ
jgi:hypothetical protein